MIDIQAKALQMEQEFWVNTTLGSVRAWKIRRKGSLHRIVIFIGLGEFCEKYADDHTSLVRSTVKPIKLPLKPTKM